MTIILEGPDGAGKTTLARYLCQTYGYEYHHTDKPEPGEDVYRTYQKALHEAKGKPVLFDRLFHGELVYGPLCRGASRLTPYQAAYLEMEAADAVVIWCYADAKRLADRGDPIYNKVPAQSLLDKYLYVREASRLTMMLYDSMTMLPTDVTLEPPTPCYLPGRWIGGGFAGVTLVGERFPGTQPHYSSDRWEKDLAHLRPFDDSRSGEYLFKALAQLSYRPANLRIVNAIKEDLDCNSGRRQLKLQCEGTKVVALGNDAENELKRAGVKVDQKVPHPQWWSRFKHAELDAYAEVLREAIG